MTHSNDDPDTDAIVWLQLDARHSYALVDKYREVPAHQFIATRVQQAAAHSAAMARRMMLGDIDKGMAPVL